jgi:hypothetical protein
MARRVKELQRFSKQFRSLMQVRSHLWAALLSFFLLILTFALPVWRVLPLASEQPFIPLHYNVHLGVDQFGPVRNLFFIPLVGLLFLVVNLVVQTIFSKREKFLTNFFSIATPVLEFILLIAMVLIVLVIL